MTGIYWHIYFYILIKDHWLHCFKPTLSSGLFLSESETQQTINQPIILLCLCVFVCVAFFYLCELACMCVSLCVCVYVCACVCWCLSVNVCVCSYDGLCVHACGYVCIDSCMCVCVRVRVHCSVCLCVSVCAPELSPGWSAGISSSVVFDILISARILTNQR